MRAAWRKRLIDGLVLSLPAGALLLVTQMAAPQRGAQLAALAAALIAIPWIMPAWVLIATLSSPLFVWLTLGGDAIDVMHWLGGVVLLASVAGCHINGMLLIGGWRKRTHRAMPRPGLADFLRRDRHGVLNLRD